MILLLVLIATFTSLSAQESHYHHISPPQPIVITLEHATSPKQIAWGLMQRNQLPWGQGMTFNFSYPQQLSFWMFNTLIDLSLAFLDHQKVISSLHELRAYPEKMDPSKSVHTYTQLLHYPEDDVINFFKEKSVNSSPTAQYAIEMSKGWFQAYDVKVGDVIVWHTRHPKGLLLRTFDVDRLISQEGKETVIELSEDSPLAVSLTSAMQEGSLTFLDRHHKVINTYRLKKNSKNVCYTDSPVRFLVIKTSTNNP